MHEIRTISEQSDRYHGWPTLTRRRSGELLVVCSGGRQSHAGPFGRVELIRSYDDGATWTWPRTILDSPIDDRDAGITETAQGTLLATTFTSVAFELYYHRAIAAAATDNPTMPKAQLARWQAVWRRLPEGQHANLLGCWMLRSEDGGLNWSPAQRVPANSPHGPVNLSDGRLLYAGVGLWTDERIVGVWTSADDGRSWDLQARLPVRPGDVSAEYHEPHAVEASDGRWVVQIRNHNSANERETLQTQSTDGGRTWTTPRPIGVWGLPSHLLRLSDGRLLMTYGHRQKPLGNQARLSEDHGATWSAPMIIQGDAASEDLGYPSTAELSPGRFVTVWYEKLPDNPLAQLRMASWELVVC
ncbi:sialidase family protein [Enhygromyxa salina]|uniref:sialidase family protein n=1 Tax=Enhygromyxa salina TaxID=215803 RepID=UPI001C63AF77|nr:sialidase family protein [Enhygromyxa salina]